MTIGGCDKSRGVNTISASSATLGRGLLGNTSQGLNDELKGPLALLGHSTFRIRYPPLALGARIGGGPVSTMMTHDTSPVQPYPNCHMMPPET